MTIAGIPKMLPTIKPAYSLTNDYTQQSAVTNNKQRNLNVDFKQNNYFIENLQGTELGLAVAGGATNGLTVIRVELFDPIVVKFKFTLNVLIDVCWQLRCCFQLTLSFFGFSL